MKTWSFLTNHGSVLHLVHAHPQITAREIATRLGITERTVLRIIGELEAAGYLTRHKEGRGNRYEVEHDLPLRRPGLRDVAVGQLLKVLSPGQDARKRASKSDRL